MVARAQALANQIPARELLEPCAKCGAESGERCTKMYGGKLMVTFESHLVRKQAAKPLL